MSFSRWLQELSQIREVALSLGNNELSALRETLQTATDDVDHLQATRSRAPDGGYWVRLPAELRSDILELVLGDGWFDHNAPIILCLVCKGWNELAISTPRLWRCITMGGFSTIDRLASLACTLLRLERANYTPLRLMIELPSRHEDMISHLIGIQWLHILELNLGRCETFTITASNRNSILDVLTHLQVPAPILSSCEFIFNPSAAHGYFAEGQSLADGLFANDSPRLISATLPSLNIQWPPSMLQNLQTVTVSNFGPCSLQRLLDFFEFSSPNLTSLSLTGFRITLSDYATHSALPLVINTTVLELTLGGRTFSESSIVLDKLDLPALRKLTVNMSGQEPTLNPDVTNSRPLPSCHSFILENEILYGGRSLRHGARAVLERLTNVRRAEIRDLATLDLFGQVIGTDEGGRFVLLCPQLEDLTCLPDVDDEGYGWESLRRDLAWLLLNRAQGNCVNLRKLTIPFYGTVHTHLTRYLKRAAPGVEVRVSGGLLEEQSDSNVHTFRV